MSEKYRNPSLTVDAIVPVRSNDSNLVGDAAFFICLITRGREPCKGMIAFPGGFVDYGEDPMDAVLRELEEETHLKSNRDNIRLITVAGNPKRDPRRHTVSVCYAVKLTSGLESLQADDDAASVAFYSLNQLLGTDPMVDLSKQMAFDHHEIIVEFAKWFKEQGESKGFYYQLSADEHL